MTASVGAACQANAWMHVAREWGFVLGVKARLSSSLSINRIDRQSKARAMASPTKMAWFETE